MSEGLTRWSIDPHVCRNGTGSCPSRIQVTMQHRVSHTLRCPVELGTAYPEPIGTPGPRFSRVERDVIRWRLAASVRYKGIDAAVGARELARSRGLMRGSNMPGGNLLGSLAPETGVNSSGSIEDPAVVRW